MAGAPAQPCSCTSILQYWSTSWKHTPRLQCCSCSVPSLSFLFFFFFVVVLLLQLPLRHSRSKKENPLPPSSVPVVSSPCFLAGFPHKGTVLQRCFCSGSVHNCSHNHRGNATPAFKDHSPLPPDPLNHLLHRSHRLTDTQVILDFPFSFIVAYYCQEQSNAPFALCFISSFLF